MKRTFILTTVSLATVAMAIAIHQAAAQQPASSAPAPGRLPAGVPGAGAPIVVAPPTIGGYPPAAGIHFVTEYTPPLHTEVEQYLAAKDDEGRQAARAKIQTSLGQLFDEQQTQREDQIKQIEEQLERLRDKVKKRAASRQQLIEHRLAGLIQDAEGLGWGSEGTAQRVMVGNGLQVVVPAAPPGASNKVAR